MRVAHIPSAAATARIVSSADATERLLYLYALDACLRPRGDAPAAVLAAYHPLRRAMDGARGALASLDDRRALAWARDVAALCRAEVDTLAPRLVLARGEVDRRDLRAALLLWAAAEAWGDGGGRWATLAGHAAALAAALDGAVDRGAAGLLTGGAASRVRARASGLWAEGGR